MIHAALWLISTAFVVLVIGWTAYATILFLGALGEATENYRKDHQILGPILGSLVSVLIGTLLLAALLGAVWWLIG